jgi:hypothetical protein
MLESLQRGSKVVALVHAAECDTMAAIDSVLSIRIEEWSTHPITVCGGVHER